MRRIFNVIALAICAVLWVLRYCLGPGQILVSPEHAQTYAFDLSLLALSIGWNLPYVIGVR
jgi:hypothetical protein